MIVEQQQQRQHGAHTTRLCLPVKYVPVMRQN